MKRKQEDEPPEEPLEGIADEDLEREWSWIKERGEYIDDQIPPKPENEFEKIWERVRKESGE